MPRMARLKARVDGGAYHIMSRTAVDRLFDNFEKDYLLKVIERYSKIYFTKVYGYAVMGNHFHLIAQMQDGSHCSESEFQRRYALYKKGCVFPPSYSCDDDEHINELKQKWSDLSEFTKDIKLSFTRWYNARHKRRGFLWGGRFKNVLLEKGEALLTCMAYVDMNPVRAGICEVPEDYRWNSLYYHLVKKNKGGWLQLDYAKPEGPYSDLNTKKEWFRFYRETLYIKGKEGRYSLVGDEVVSQAKIPDKKFKNAEKKGFRYSYKEILTRRCRYFTDSVIIGSKEFVRSTHSQYKERLFEKRKRSFPSIKGCSNIYSMRDLRKDIFAA